MKRYIILSLIVALSCLTRASAATNAFNCTSFATTGSCSAGGGGLTFTLAGNGPPSISGSQVLLMPTGAKHQGDAMNYYLRKVNVQSFTTSFRFIPNGWNLAFVLQNNSNPAASPEGPAFAAGAGCEAGFYQAFASNGVSVTNIFALELDSQSYLNASEAFPYSTVQIYKAGQSPCNPNNNAPNYYLTDKISTSPVPLTSPANALGSTTGNTYSATITYDGSNVVLNMYDMTSGGSCPGSSCFTRTWTDVNIPSLVNGTTAWVGLTTATNEASSHPLYIDSFSYTEGATGGTTTSGSTTQTATPTISPAAGTYSSAQSVVISDSTAGATVYYTTNGSTPTTSSSEYTGPIAVGSSVDIKAMAVAGSDASSGVASAAYTINPTDSSSGSAEVINYPAGFASNPSQVWVGNGSFYSGSSIRLTNSIAGAAHNAWFKTPVNVQGFTTTFTWTAKCPAKPAQCGDGMGFMLISTSNPSSSGYNYSGSDGSQFSWSRCYGSAGATNCPTIKSVLVKFDLYNNATSQDGASLTGFYSGGLYPQPPQPESDMTASGIDLQSGHLMKATLSYNGSVLMEAVTDTVTGSTYRNSYSANIPALVGGDTAFVGFGGSTGGASVTQDLSSWTYTVESPVN